MFTFLLCSLSLSRFHKAVPVTDNDILMTRQEYGKTNRDRSVDGNKLTIAGVQYETGIGTHAVSMIPMTVPDNAIGFQGVCGVDDEVSQPGIVNFFISTGSEIVFTSGPVGKGVAVRFNIKLDNRVTKLYLLVNDIDDNNQGCHADWVDLKFVEGTKDRPGVAPTVWDGKRSVITLKASDFGIRPDTGEDSGPKFRALLSFVRSLGGQHRKLYLQGGVYDFYPSGALNMSFHVSNHDQPNIHSIGFPLIDLEDLVIYGNGSVFRMHGLMLPVVIMDSRQVTLCDVEIDFARNYYSEAQVVDIGLVSVTVSIDKKEYPYHIESDHLVFDGEGWTNPASSIIAFEGGTNHIVAGTSDMAGPDTVVVNEDGTISFAHNMKSQGVKKGDWLVLRSWS